MSHYGIIVFSNKANDLSFDELLYPYDEEKLSCYTFHPKPYEEIEKEFESFHKQNSTWTFDMYMKNFRYKKHKGKWGLWYNDNAKYDYYSLDGCAWLEEDLIPDGTLPDNKYYRYRKSQIKLKSDDDVPIAFVTPDGVWHSAGTVGWFAACDDTKESWESHIKEFKEFLAAPGDEYVSFVDCHI